MIKIKRVKCYLSQKHFSKQMFFLCVHVLNISLGVSLQGKNARKICKEKKKTLDVTEVAEHHRN